MSQTTLKNLSSDLSKLQRQSHDLEGFQKRKRSFEKSVEDFNEKRIEAFCEELERMRLSWCTDCKKQMPLAEAKLMFFGGLKVQSGGYEGGDWGIVDRNEYHRLCPACHERAVNRHGERGETCAFTHRQEIFYAFEVKKEGEKFLAKKFGVWETIPFPKNFRPPSALVELLAEEMGLPPEQKIEQNQLAVAA